MKILRAIAFPFFLSLLWTSCKKDHSVLGTGVLPGSDEVNADFVETSPVYAFTEQYDSVFSLGTRYKFIGSNNDPYFGRTDIGLYLNANLSLTNQTFSTSARLYSGEIILKVDNLNYFGDLNSLVTFSVFAIDSSLSATRPYYTTNKRLHNKQNLLSVRDLRFSIFKGTPVLRIPVDSTYASRIMKDDPALRDNASFQAKYRGFYISTQLKTSEGIIYSADLEDGVSGFYLHYKPTPGDTIHSFRFAFSGTSSGKYNTVTQDLSAASASFKSQLGGDSLQGMEALFLKGMGIARLKVHIPFLKNYSDSFYVAVNRAEVVFHLHPDYTNDSKDHAVPPRLSLLPLDSAGREIITQDQKNSTDLARYDGSYDLKNKRYVFNIARHAQAIFKGEKKNYGFRVVVANPSFPNVLLRDENIEQVILAGSNKGTFRPKFNLSYIKLKKDS